MCKYKDRKPKNATLMFWEDDSFSWYTKDNCIIEKKMLLHKN